MLYLCQTTPTFFEHKHRVVYSKIELTDEIDKIEHPAVRAILQEHPITTGLEIHHDGDLPSESGLGSSSSFTVGLINAVFAFKGMHIPRDLAKEAIRIERHVIGDEVGYQDQIWAAHEGMNVISLDTNGDYDVAPLILTKPKLESLLEHMLLFYTAHVFNRHFKNENCEYIKKRKNFDRIGKSPMRL